MGLPHLIYTQFQALIGSLIQDKATESVFKSEPFQALIGSLIQAKVRTFTFLGLAFQALIGSLIPISLSDSNA